MKPDPTQRQTDADPLQYRVPAKPRDDHLEQQQARCTNQHEWVDLNDTTSSRLKVDAVDQIPYQPAGHRDLERKGQPFFVHACLRMPGRILQLAGSFIKMSERSHGSRDSLFTESHGNPFAPPIALSFLKYTGHPRAAVTAVARIVAVETNVPIGEFIPIPADEAVVARMAVGAVPIKVMDIARIGIADTVGQRDLPCTRQSRFRGARFVHHLPVGVEGTKMHRHIRAQVLDHPGCHIVDLFLRIILARNNKVRDLKPHVGFVLQILERIQDLGEF